MATPGLVDVIIPVTPSIFIPLVLFPKVEIPEILNAVPTKLSDIVMVAMPLAPVVAVALIFPPTKFNVVMLPEVPTLVPSS